MKKVIVVGAGNAPKGLLDILNTIPGVQIETEHAKGCPNAKAKDQDEDGQLYVTSENCEAFIFDLEAIAQEIKDIIYNGKLDGEFSNVLFQVTMMMMVRPEVYDTINAVQAKRLADVLDTLKTIVCDGIQRVVTNAYNIAKDKPAKKVINTFKTPQYEDLDKDELIALLRAQDAKG